MNGSIALCVLLCVFGCAIADPVARATVTADVVGTLKLPNGQSIRAISQLQPPQLASVTLHSATLTLRTSARGDGLFTFHQVPPGVYMLTAEFAHLTFPLVRVSVLETRTGILRVRALINDATQKPLDADGTPDSPLPLIALGRQTYFVPREEYSILSFLKNPMIIMMVVSVGMMGLMKLVPQEELRQQMKDMNKQVQESKQQLGLEKKAQ